MLVEGRDVRIFCVQYFGKKKRKRKCLWERTGHLVANSAELALLCLKFCFPLFPFSFFFLPSFPSSPSFSPPSPSLFSILPSLSLPAPPPAHSFRLRQGETFDVPEVVPFRLTPNMVHAMGPMGTEGLFRQACEVTLRLMRDQREPLMRYTRA